MPLDCGSASDAGTWPRQEVTSRTPEWVKNGVRMEETTLITRTELGATILALADGHTSVQVAPGLLVGGRECSISAIESVREHASRLVKEPEYVFGMANESIRTSVHLELEGVTTFRPASRERTSTCGFSIRGRPQPPPFHGTTLTTLAVLARYRVVLAYIGDSSALFVPRRPDKLPRWLHSPHTSENLDEDARVRALGVKTAKRELQAKVTRHRYNYHVGEHSFKCGLTRTLGSFGVEALLADPEVVDITLEQGVLLLGSGGFWETIDLDTIVTACATYTTSQEICDVCMEKCRSVPSRPNCSVVCTILEEDLQNVEVTPARNISSALVRAGVGVTVTNENMRWAAPATSTTVRKEVITLRAGQETELSIKKPKEKVVEVAEVAQVTEVAIAEVGPTEVAEVSVARTAVEVQKPVDTACRVTCSVM